MGNGADSKNHLTCASLLAATFEALIRFGGTLNALASFMLAMMRLCVRSLAKAVRVSFRPAETCRNLARQVVGKDGISSWLQNQIETLSRSVTLHDVALQWFGGVNYSLWREPCVGSIGVYRRSTFAAWAERWVGRDFIESFSIRRLAVCRVRREDVHCDDVHCDDVHEKGKRSRTRR